MAQVKNTPVKWSIKPCIVRTKKTSKALRKDTVDWKMKNSNVYQYPISRDTLLIADADNKVKCRVPNVYWSVPCNSCTMISLLHEIMEV